MRKVLSFVLVLSLILGSFSFAFAAGGTSEFADVKDTTAEGPVAVLSALDVINGYPDGTFKPEKVVTRAEMAKLIVKALGMDSYVAGMYTTFGDAKGHWAENYVAWCSSYGIVEGYPDGTFKPNNTVTLQQAVTMIVRALGYQDQYLTGTWPTSHVSMAMSLDILEDIVATTAGATRGDVARMLYNALDCSLINYDSNGNLAVTGDSMLKRLGAYEFEQVITRDNAIDAAIDVNDYVGAHAKFWAINADKDKATGIYDYNAVNKEGIIVGGETRNEAIVAVEEQISTMLTGEFTAKADDKSEFVVGDKTYSFKFSSEAKKVDQCLNADGTLDAKVVQFLNGDVGGNSTFVANDKVDGEFITSNWNTHSKDADFTIAAKVSGNYITRLYSVLKWDADDEIEWDDDYASEVKDDQEIANFEFTLDDDDAIDTKTFALRGAESLDKIANGNVVTVYTSKETDEITRVEVGTTTVDGKITKVNKAGDEFTIDGKVYDKSANIQTVLEVGTEGVFSLNYNGEIAFVNESSYTGNYAVVLTQAKTGDDYSDDKIQLLTKDDEQAVYNFSKTKTAASFAASGNSGTVVDAANYNTDKKMNTPGALLEIKTNAAGKLVEATIPGPDNSPRAKFIANKKLSTKNLFDGKQVLKDAVVFVVPSFDGSALNDKNTGFDKKEDCYVTTIADVTNDEAFDAIYAWNKDGKINAMVVEKSAVGSNDLIGIITGYSLIPDSDDNTVYSLDVLADGKATTYETDILKDDVTDGAIIENDANHMAKLYQFKMSGDVITGLTELKTTNNTLVGKAAPMDKFADADADAKALYFNDGNTVKNIADADVTFLGVKASKVLKKSVDDINLGVDGGADNFQNIADAKVYQIKVKTQGEIDDMVVSSVDKVRADSIVILLQLDEDSEAWDTVVYMTKSDFDTYK